MNAVYRCAVMGCLLLVSGCGGRLAMVGFDKHARSTEALVREEKYAETLKEAILTVEESVVPALSTQQGAGDWKLRTAVVGFGLKVEGGIGPFKVAFKPRIRAAFANGEKPPIP